MLSHQTPAGKIFPFALFSSCRKEYIFFVFLLMAGCHNKTNLQDKMPDENRFKRVVLQEHLYNPQELEITNDGSIYFIQTDGKLIKLDPDTKATKVVGYVKNSDNGEFGLIGM